MTAPPMPTMPQSLYYAAWTMDNPPSKNQNRASLRRYLTILSSFQKATIDAKIPSRRRFSRILLRVRLRRRMPSGLHPGCRLF